MCFFADLCIFVLLFLFRSFCSAIFVLFLFRWGLFALKPHLPHYLIDNFCSADLFILALTNFFLLFLFRYFYSAGAFLHLNLNQFLFHCFCSTGAFFCSATFVPLGLFLFCYFCSAIFVVLFLFCWAFFVALFLFR